MTIFARRRYRHGPLVYQMTLHDEWDYDSVNEMILSDQEMGGQARKLLTHFDRNGLGYTLDRVTGECWLPKSTIPRSTGPPA
jgi:glucose dehydrogenase